MTYSKEGYSFTAIPKILPHDNFTEFDVAWLMRSGVNLWLAPVTVFAGQSANEVITTYLDDVIRRLNGDFYGELKQ